MQGLFVFCPKQKAVKSLTQTFYVAKNSEKSPKVFENLVYLNDVLYFCIEI